MNTLKKRPTYDNLVYYLNHQPTIKYPARKGISAINNPIISNLLFDDYTMEDMLIQSIKTAESSTQTPHEQGTQTDNFEKGTQRDYTVKYDYDEPENPHLYRKIDATSKRLKHHLDTHWFFRPKEKMKLLLKCLILKMLN